jgi:light-regulated signal transduction histidine kinase (bacteriophytochrome)
MNRELDAFAHSVSHDLRGPLRSLDGFSHALMEDHAEKLDGEARDFLNRISKASRRMGRMIDDILALSRATRQEKQTQHVNLSRYAQAILGDLREREPDRSVTIVIAPNVTAQGDPRLLQVVLTNLLDNAWKFTSKKEAAKIEFGVSSKDREPVYFVPDDGAGFDMAYADKLFGIFQRLHSATEFEGTGIGLVTVARLVRRHGGRVWAEGEENMGASFYFTLGR